MGTGYNPKIVTDGLVLCLDAGNPNKSAKGFKSLTSLSDWTLGSGGTATYNRNGTVDENQRILDTGPFGTSTVVWDGPLTDETSDAESGFWGPSINIDPTKLYRFSIWMRRKVIGDGSSYLGCHAWDASTTQHVLNRSNGATNQNPYFLASVWWGNANDWYLVTGHIWPAGSGTGSAKTDSGIYNTSGTKISGTTDFVWQTTNTYTYVRSFLYYSTVTTTNQQLYYPRIDLCDGTEPTIAELIAGVGSKWYDLTGTNHGNILNSAALYNSAGYMNFDGVDDYVDCGSNIQLTNNFTLEVWHKNINTGYIIDQGAIGDDPTNSLEYANRGLSLTFNNTGGVSATGTFSNTTIWNHVCCSFSSGTVKFYINGLLDSIQTAPRTEFVPSGSLKIGRRAFNTSGILSGTLGVVKIYNKVLSDEEVRQNFNATRGRFGI